MYSGLEFLEDLLMQARRMDTENYPLDDPPYATNARHGPLPEGLRGLYVILCNLRETSGTNLRLGDKFLAPGEGVAVLQLSQQVALGRGKLTEDVQGIEQLFWWLVRKEIPGLPFTENLAVGADWMVVEIDNPTGF